MQDKSFKRGSRGRTPLGSDSAPGCFKGQHPLVIMNKGREMKEQTVEKIKAAGVVGAGGAGLPTHIKAGAAVDTVLVNGASCEPLLAGDPYLMEVHAETVIAGLLAVMGCTGAVRGIICLKGKHKKALAAMEEVVARHPDRQLDVFTLKDFYPAGDEHVLVHEVLGRIVPQGGIPLQAGTVVSNVETFYNIALAMAGKAVTHRYVTVAGEVARPLLLKVPVGTLASDIITRAGGALINDYRVVDGGPMMGRVLVHAAMPVTKTTSGLLVLPAKHTVVNRKVMAPEKVRKITTSRCCQCSQCTDLCPRHLLGHNLHPHKLMRFFDQNIAANPVAREALLCSECGVCEKFSCPMLVSPREVNAQIKQMLRKEGVRWEGSDQELTPHPFKDTRYIPTRRLVSRLQLTCYDANISYAGVYTPDMVKIPLLQHIGAPARCVVQVGDRVKQGDVIGEVMDGDMGAPVHASIKGIVEAVTDGMITIKGC